MWEDRAEGILFKVLGVGGEHQEFVLGGMGETNPRETKKDNKIQATHEIVRFEAT